jgi:hypothetical protein
MSQHQRPLFKDLSGPGAYSGGSPKRKTLLDLRPLEDQGTPDFSKRAPLPLARIPLPGPPSGAAQEYAYRLGECPVILTHDGGTYGWHLSISHKRRYPMWDEIAEARYRLLPAHVCMAMILPSMAHYVNVHTYCFQLIEIPIPDTTRVVPEEQPNAPLREITG